MTYKAKPERPIDLFYAERAMKCAVCGEVVIVPPQYAAARRALCSDECVQVFQTQRRMEGLAPVKIKRRGK